MIAGAEPRSNVGSGSVGLLLIHGFTGTPASVAPIADAALAADVPFELPLLSGHGTDIHDLEAVRWSDWMADLDRAHERLARRCDRIVACGQSMGGALALALTLQDTDRSQDTSQPGSIVGIVAINPLTTPRTAEEMALIADLLEDGLEIAPGGDSDIADPDALDVGYQGTPLRALQSALIDGIEPIASRYGEITVPLLLYTSRQDHVVEPANSEYLAANYGGKFDQVWLEQSFHVAAIDFDRDTIAAGTIEMLSRVTP